VEHFVDKFRREMRKEIQGIDNAALQALLQHEWKGEIRELENIIERAVIFCNTNLITLNDFPEFFRSGTPAGPVNGYPSLEEAMNNFERQYIHAELRKQTFNKESAAKSLKISLPTLYRRIKDLGIPND
jgi:transcriptional regulator with PAS, ATPase and Fis domain